MRALITGVAGQDGSYLAELLLEKGYEVHGVVHAVNKDNLNQHLWRIREFKDKIHLHLACIEDYPSIFNITKLVKPDECYHLAAKIYTGSSLENELSTLNTNINGVYNILSSVRSIVPDSRFYFASSSEMFGNITVSPQSETTEFNPRCPYGISKIIGFDLTKSYRQAYGLKACSGILFNHESPRRNHNFVSRKITVAAAKIKLGLEAKFELGNLDAKRDWGHAREYVQLMWQMLQEDEPDDYVISSGESHSVRDFMEAAFNYVNIDPYDFLVINSDLYREAEQLPPMGNSSKAEQKLGWNYTFPFKDLVEEMVESDLHYYGSLKSK